MRPDPSRIPFPPVQPLHPLRAPLLVAAGFRHAFFTRRGGVSPAPFDSLNFAVHVGDDAGLVARNLAIAAQDLGVEPDRILYLQQVHGTTCHVVAPPFHHDETWKLEGDAVIAHDGTVACGVRVADCAPVLIADRCSGLAAAVHSGWRGTEQDIVGHVVRKLREMGSHPRDLVAAVGPHIERCCFETGHDVAAHLSRVSPVGDILHLGSGGRPHVDLRRILHAQLLEAGLGHEQVDHVRGCTMCEPDRFFSYRRDGQRSGRLLAAIVPHA
jgi:hypothetical protein